MHAFVLRLKSAGVHTEVIVLTIEFFGVVHAAEFSGSKRSELSDVPFLRVEWARI